MWCPAWVSLGPGRALRPLRPLRAVSPAQGPTQDGQARVGEEEPPVGAGEEGAPQAAGQVRAAPGCWGGRGVGRSRLPCI